MRALLLGVLTLLALCSAAPAHGGRYRGPADQVDPSLRQMSDPPPPESGGGPVGDPVRVDSTARYPRPTFESWRFWWRTNEESLLEPPCPGTLPSPEVIEERIVPLLDRLARGDAPRVEGLGAQIELQATALLGLARLGRAEQIPTLLEIAGDSVGKHSFMARESACLSLGLMGVPSPEVLSFLRRRAADESGRYRIRCNAIFALGLLGRARGNPDPELLAVFRAVVQSPTAEGDVRLSALAAMGLLGDVAAVPDLLRWIEARKAGERALDDCDVAHAAAALGRIGAPGLPGGSGRDVVDALASLLRGARPLPRWSAAIALGRIGAAGDAATSAACAGLLREAVAKEAWTPGDAQGAQFAIAALGRAAAGERRTAAEREPILKTLSGVLREGAEGGRAFAALALAVAGRRLAAEERERVATALRGELARSRANAEAGGAAAVALGLIGDTASAATLREMLDVPGGDPNLRADAALALGLMRDPAAIPSLRKALDWRAGRVLVHDAALAVGLLGDRGSVEPLIGLIAEFKVSPRGKGAAARALGWIGDPDSVDRLLAIANHPEVTETERAFAVVALVRIATGGKDADLAPLSEDLNYRAWFYTLGEVLTLL
jgi:HEAT repeat protein